MRLTRRVVCALGVWAAAGLVSSATATGLPGEFMLSNRWRPLLTGHSPLSNPAYMTERNYTAIRGVFCGGPQTAGTLWELGVVVPLGLYQSAGFGVIAENGGDLDNGSIDDAGNFDPSDTKKTNDNYFGMFSYAINPIGKLSVGANINVVYQSTFGEESEYGVGADLGISYRLLNHPLLGYHLAGLTYQNLIPPNLSVSGDDSYSSQLKLGLWSLLWERRIESILELNITDFTTAAENYVGGDKSVEWELNWVLGGWILRMFNAYLVLAFDDLGMQYWAWALGVNLPSLNGGRDLAVAYQFRDEIDVPLRATHSVYLRMDVGKHREERQVKRYSHDLTWEANDLYSRAMSLWSRGKYLDAFFVFSDIVVNYPDFFKMDWVTYYRGNCLEQLDMRDAAKAIYRRGLAEYEQSDSRAYAELGLARLHYRDREYTEIFDLYLSLNRPTVPDSMRHHASYLMGEALFNEGRTKDAIRVLRKIPTHHPNYVFAQHTAAIAGFVTDDVMTGRTSLEAAVTAMARTPAEREMVHRSIVLMGYVYYEQDSLATAVAALRMVPPTSMYYPDALLGLGWCAVKAQQWADAVRVGQELRLKAPFAVLKAEACVLEASGRLMQKDFGGALAVLEEGDRIAGALGPTPEDTLRERRLSYETERQMYGYVADDLIKVSLKQRSDAMLAKVDSVRTKAVSYKKKLNDYEEWRDAQQRLSYFSRSLEDIKDDIDYLRAIAEKRSGQQQQYKAVKDVYEKQQEIDQELLELKKQMEALDEGGEQPQ